MTSAAAPVLFIMPHVAFGGAERLASDLARHLGQAGRAVHLAVLSSKPGEDDAASDWFAPHVANIVRLDLAGFQLGVRLAGIVAAAGAATAVIIGLSPVFPALAEIRERQPDLRVVSFQFNERELTAEHGEYASMIDAIVVEGALVSRTLVGLGVAEDKIMIIPSAPDLARLAAGREVVPAALRERVGPTVGFVGRMDPIKGPHFFVEICGRLRRYSVSFVMAGDGPMSSQVRAAIRDNGLSERVLWLGRLSYSAIADVYHNLDIVVVPSFVDGRPSVVQEAQACGAAVVASQVGAIPELVQDGESGLLCPPGDIDAFAEGIARLLDHADLRRHMADVGRSRVQREGGLAKSLNAYFEAIIGYSLARSGTYPRQKSPRAPSDSALDATRQ